MTSLPRRIWRYRIEEGQTTAFVVTFFAALILLAGLVLDGGLALDAKLRALNTAESAARAGAQAIDPGVFRRSGEVVLDPARARAAARDYLTVTGHTGSVTVAGDRVTVTVRVTQPAQILRIAGIDSFHMSGTATATAQPGITGPLP